MKCQRFSTKVNVVYKFSRIVMKTVKKPDTVHGDLLINNTTVQKSVPVNIFLNLNFNIGCG